MEEPEVRALLVPHAASVAVLAGERFKQKLPCWGLCGWKAAKSHPKNPGISMQPYEDVPFARQRHGRGKGFGTPGAVRELCRLSGLGCGFRAQSLQFRIGVGMFWRMAASRSREEGHDADLRQHQTAA